MRILSIDLPWAAKGGIFGFAACSLEAGRIADLDVCAIAGRGRDPAAIFATYAGDRGRYDLILLDHPIGGGASPASTAYRSVEQAFANAYFATNPSTGRRIQMPRFQPGAVHAAAGLRIAVMLREVLGTPSSVVVESFPQLSIGALLEYAGENGMDTSPIDRLKTHKVTPWANAAAAQQSYVDTIGHFLRRPVQVVADSVRQGADAVDALLALPAGVVAAGYRPPGSDGARSWSRAYWLLSEPAGDPPHPAAVHAKKRKESRGCWVAPLSGEVGEGGVRETGILTLGLPGWGAPRQSWTAL